MRPLEGYGCTELTPVASANLPDEEIGGVKQISNGPGTIGPPMPGVAGRVVHPETRAELPDRRGRAAADLRAQRDARLSPSARN